MADKTIIDKLVLKDDERNVLLQGGVFIIDDGIDNDGNHRETHITFGNPISVSKSGKLKRIEFPLIPISALKSGKLNLIDFPLAQADPAEKKKRNYRDEYLRHKERVQVANKIKSTAKHGYKKDGYPCRFVEKGKCDHEPFDTPAKLGSHLYRKHGIKGQTRKAA